MKIEDILSRRSVRKYTDRKVTDEEIRKLLEAAMAAPSACACDPWSFIVLRTPEELALAAEALPYGKFLTEAGVGIIVCGDLKKAYLESLSYLLQDCSAAIQNILLAATVFGLGGCWIGIHPVEERITKLRKSFNVPKNVIPVGAISIGEPLDPPTPRTRYQEDKVHYGKWQEED